ncbi:MAG: protein kinase [Clostridia bacterium]|nr:protein kinase [Clostridia bacterium]
MDLKYDNCPHCFSQANGGDRCSVCGYQYSRINSQPDNVLPAFTMLNNRYLIGHCLGKGGFGITYAALDLAMNVRCAIKEYYPSEFAVRNAENNGVYPAATSKGKNVFEHAKERFLDEARLLYQLRDTPSIVRLYNYFSENNTAYIVMEFLEGNDLRKYAKNSGGKISLDMAADVINTCAPALEAVHKKGFLHRDISPDNIFVKNDRKGTGHPTFVLLDFGAARNFIGNNAPTVLLKPGFAPPEAYSKTGNKGPWTDVYSLAATIYNVLSGQTIVDALFRARGTRQPTLYELGINVPKAFSDEIDRAMMLDFRQRPQSMSEFHSRIMTSLNGFVRLNDILPTGRIDTTITHTNGVSVEPVTHVTRKRVVGKVYIADGIKSGNSITVEDGQTIKIGRSVQSSDLVLDYISEISRIHCTVSFSSKERLFYITDLSTNGTFFDTNERFYVNRTYRVASGQRFFLVRRDCMLMVKTEEVEE